MQAGRPLHRTRSPTASIPPSILPGSHARIPRARTSWDRGPMPRGSRSIAPRTSIPVPQGSSHSLADQRVDRRQDRLDRVSISSRWLGEGRYHSPLDRSRRTHKAGSWLPWTRFHDRGCHTCGSEKRSSEPMKPRPWGCRIAPSLASDLDPTTLRFEARAPQVRVLQAKGLLLARVGSAHFASTPLVPSPCDLDPTVA
jgi:hypothetical protein